MADIRVKLMGHDQSQKDLHSMIVYEATTVKERFQFANDSHSKLYDYAHRETDYYEVIQNSVDQLRQSLTKEMDKLLQQVLGTLSEQDQVIAAAQMTSDRIERMYEVMKIDIHRQETLSYELAAKFDQQHTVIKDFANNIEALKTYTIISDLHMEAYQPLQTATIAYEVGKGLVQKKHGGVEKYQRYFQKRIIKQLEKNCVNVCDPQVDTFITQYRKMNYELPMEIQERITAKDKLRSNEKPQWKNILSKISLGNINLFNNAANNGEEELKTMSKDPRSKLAETLMRRKPTDQNLSQCLFLESHKYHSTSLQEQFSQLSIKIADRMKTPIDLSFYKPFQLAEETILKSVMEAGRPQYGDLQSQKLKLERRVSNHEVRERIFQESQEKKQIKQALKRKRAEIKEQEVLIAQNRRTGSDIDVVENALYSKRFNNNGLEIIDTSSDEDNGVHIPNAQERFKQIDILTKATEKRIKEERNTISEQMIKQQRSFDQKLQQSETNIIQRIGSVQKKVEEKIRQSQQNLDKYANIKRSPMQVLQETVIETESEFLDRSSSSVSGQKADIKHESLSITGSSQSIFQQELKEGAIKSPKITSRRQNTSGNKIQAFDLPYISQRGLNHMTKRPKPIQKETREVNQPIKLAQKKDRVYSNFKQVPEKTSCRSLSAPQSSLQDDLKVLKQPILAEKVQESKYPTQAAFSDQIVSSESELPIENVNVIEAKISPKQSGAQIQKSRKIQSETKSADNDFAYMIGKLDNEPINIPLVQTNTKVVAPPSEQTHKVMQSSNQNSVLTFVQKHDKSDQNKASNPNKSKTITKASKSKQIQDQHTDWPQAVQKVNKVDTITARLEIEELDIEKDDINKIETVLEPTKEQLTAFSLLTSFNYSGKIEVKQLDSIQQKIQPKQNSSKQIQLINTKPTQIVKVQPVKKAKLIKDKPTEILQDKNLNNPSTEPSNFQTESESDSGSNFSSEYFNERKCNEKLKAYISLDQHDAIKHDLEQGFLMQNAFREKQLHEVFEKFNQLNEHTRSNLLVINNIDWAAMKKAEAMMAESVRQIAEFKQEFHDKFRYWRQRSQNLQLKYENITLWTKMFSEMNLKVKEEVLTNSSQNKKSFETIIDYIKLQIFKDQQDEIDMQSLGFSSSDIKVPFSDEIIDRAQFILKQKENLNSMREINEKQIQRQKIFAKQVHKLSDLSLIEVDPRSALSSRFLQDDVSQTFERVMKSSPRQKQLERKLNRSSLNIPSQMYKSTVPDMDDITSIMSNEESTMIQESTTHKASIISSPKHIKKKIQQATTDILNQTAGQISRKIVTEKSYMSPNTEPTMDQSKQEPPIVFNMSTLKIKQAKKEVPSHWHSFNLKNSSKVFDSVNQGAKKILFEPNKPYRTGLQSPREFTPVRSKILYTEVISSEGSNGKNEMNLKSPGSLINRKIVKTETKFKPKIMRMNKDIQPVDNGNAQWQQVLNSTDAQDWAKLNTKQQQSNMALTSKGFINTKKIKKQQPVLFAEKSPVFAGKKRFSSQIISSEDLHSQDK